VAGTAEDGTPIIRNPATRPTMELLDNVLALARFTSFLLCFLFLFAYDMRKILH